MNPSAAKRKKRTSVLSALSILIGAAFLLPASLHASAAVPETRIGVSGPKNRGLHSARVPRKPDRKPVAAHRYDGTASERPDFTWDSQGRLVQVTKNQVLALRAAYLDDYRLYKEETPGKAVFNHWTFGNIFDEVDALSNQTTTSYVMAPGLDNHLARGPPTTSKDLQQTDHVGTIVGAMDEFGRQLSTPEYFAFGAHRSSDLPIKVGFHGGREYQDAGLVYFRKRWYSPELGRFISRDPIGFAGGFNLYQFVGNNPVLMRDSMGDIPPLILAALLSGSISTGIDSAIKIFWDERLPTCLDLAEAFTLGAIVPGGGIAGSAGATAFREFLKYAGKEFLIETAGGTLFDELRQAMSGCETGLLDNFMRRALSNLFGLGLGKGMERIAGLLGRLKNKLKGFHEGEGGSLDLAVIIDGAGRLRDSLGRFLKGTGGESAETAAGRRAHDLFNELLEQKNKRRRGGPGWQTGDRIPVGDSYGIPDAISPLGHPFELKPLTESGIRRGRRQLKKYEESLGRKGRVVYYDPQSGELLSPWHR